MTHLPVTIGLLLLGAVSGLVAELGRLPLPFLLGPLLACGAVATLLAQRLPAGYGFPAFLRLAFIAVIGLIVFGQRLDFPAVAGMCMILGGILVIHLFSNATPH